MKKTMLVLVLSISTVFAIGQKDSIAVNDSMPLVSIKQLNLFAAEMEKVFTISESEKYKFLVQKLQALVGEAIINRSKKTK